MKIVRFVFLLAVLQSSGMYAFSQKRHIQFEHLGINLGLSHSNVTSIFQDSRGFMWFGTRDGLDKYDGYKFTVYKYDVADSNSISHNTIQDIAEDNDGNLWIATWGGGLNMFDRTSEKFVHYKAQNNFNTAGSKLINCVLCDQDGNIWIGTEGQGLQVLDKKKKQFISYIHSDSDPQSLCDNFVKDIIEDQEHRLWIGTRSGGLNMLDITRKQFILYKHDEKNSISISSDATWNLFIDSKDQLWIGTRDGGINLFGKDRKEFIPYKTSLTNLNSIQSNVIRAISEDDAGNIWVGTENGGLSIIHPSKTIDNYLSDDVDNAGINNNSIWSVYKDKKGNMWIGTFSAGIDFVNRDASKFPHYRHDSSPSSLSNNSVLSIFEDSRKNIWMGTDGGGLNLFNPDKGTFTHYLHEPGNPNSICGNYILKVFEDTQGNLWIGTWGDGITVFNKEKNTFKHFKQDPSNPKSLAGNNAWTIAEDSDKNIWIGLYNGSAALDMYDRKTNSFIHYKNDISDPGSLSNNTVNTIYVDRSGHLWIGTNGGGLDLFDKKTKTFSHLTEETKRSISNNDVSCVAEDEAGNLWIGSNLGLNRVNKKDGTVTSYFLKDGLPSNTITGILPDGKGKLWISTFNGLSRFDPASKSFKNFSINDGLQSSEFKMNSCFKSSTGRLYFGGINGFNVFFPDSIQQKKFDPPLVFTDFMLFNKRVSISTNKDNLSPLHTAITDARNIELSYKQSVITFEFASLNYAAPDKNQYSYMLEGFDKDWNYVGSRHAATYTNLDAGTYLFKVRQLNNEGQWSLIMATIQLTIKPPFWLTWWFRIGIGVLIIGGALGYYKFRINMAEAQQIKLQAKVDEQTSQLLRSTNEEQRARKATEYANKELESKNKELEEFAYVASHDLQEPLRTTSSFVGLLQQQYKGKLDEKADKYFDFISQSTDRMKVLIKDLLDYSRIGRKKEMNIVDSNTILKNVLADLNLVIKETATVINFGPLPVFNGYPTEIKLLFQNLILNAIKFRKKDKTPVITISAVLNNGRWEYVFEDNGIGIDNQHLERIFIIFQRLHTRSEYEGSGIGLAHCKKIVEMHGGNIWVTSKPGTGANFIFTIAAEGKNVA